MFKNNKFARQTISQALVCILLLPFIACLIGVFKLDIGQICVDFIGEISVMNIWFALLVDFSSINDIITELENFSNASLIAWSFMMYEIWIVALVAGIVREAFKKIGMKGLPILPTVATVIIYAIVNKIANINYISALIELIVLAIIYLCIMFFVSNAKFFLTILTGAFKLYIDSCIALSATAYIAVMALIINGKLSGFAEVFTAVMLSMMALLLSLLVDFALTSLTDKK